MMPLVPRTTLIPRKPRVPPTPLVRPEELVDPIMKYLVAPGASPDDPSSECPPNGPPPGCTPVKPCPPNSMTCSEHCGSHKPDPPGPPDDPGPP